MINALHQQVATWLSEDPFFAGPAGIQVFTERQADWLNTLKIEVEVRTGMGLVVAVPAITKSRTGETAIDVSVVIHVWENVTLNTSSSGRGVAATDVALHVVGALIRREPPGGWSPLILDAIRLGDAAAGGFLMYEVVMKTSVSLRKK